MKNIDIIELEKVKSLLKKRQSSGVSGTEVIFFYRNVQFEEFQCFFQNSQKIVQIVVDLNQWTFYV